MKKKIVIEEKKEIMVYVGKLESLLKVIPQRKYSNIVAVTHKSLYEIYKYKIQSLTKNIVFLPEGEKVKSIKFLLYLYRKFLEKQLNRKSLVIIIGGGVLGDVVGFASSTYMRGVDYVQVPTTLLAMVDSSIGGKTAVDIKEGKNLIGSFYQPKLILCDFSFLSTLPKKEIFNGFGEIVKYAVINKKIFKILDTVEENKVCATPFPVNNFTKKLILECIDTKLQIVKQDEKEITGVREKLNFGHTIAHAVESSTGYRFYTHGEAVFLGILAESYISYKLGILKEKEYQKIVKLVNKFTKNYVFSDKILSITPDRIFYHVKFDKKVYKNNYRLALPVSVGNVKTIEFVPPKVIKQSIDFVKQWLKTKLS